MAGDGRSTVRLLNTCNNLHKDVHALTATGYCFSLRNMICSPRTNSPRFWCVRQRTTFDIHIRLNLISIADCCQQGSAAAGMIGRVFCHPLDTVKARLQASTASGNTIASLLNLRAFSLQHLRGLYRGIGVSMLGSAPATCLYMTSYEVSKDALVGVESFQVNPSLLYLGAGMAAEALSCVLWVPIDVIKERMQVQVQPSAESGMARKIYYRNTLDAVQTIARTERLSGLYKGYVATLLSFGPFSALYFMFYEQAKAFAQKRLEVDELPAQYTLASAAVAGATASFLTNPLDLIKLRLQVQRAYVTEGSPAAYRGIVDGLAQVIRTEGVLALYKGAGARVAFHAPSTAITMSLFESCRRVFANLLDV